MSETTPLPRFDNEAAYAARQPVAVNSLENGDALTAQRAAHTPWQKEQLRRESRIFGINPDHQADAFVDAHNHLLSDMEQDLQEQLPVVKEQIIDRTATYFFANAPDKKANLRAVLEQRLSATNQVAVNDGLVTSTTSSGSFNGMTRQPMLNSGRLVEQLDECDDAQDYKTRVYDVILAHELMHGMFTAGTQDTLSYKDTSVRNGLAVSQYENPMSPNMSRHDHGTWLNEATLESFRQTIMQTEEVHYEPGVMILHMLEELSPGIRDEAVLTALGGEGPGPLFGKIEGLLGPTAIEELGADIASVRSRDDFGAFKKKIVSRLPQELQAQGYEAINRAQQAIYAHRQ